MTSYTYKNGSGNISIDNKLAFATFFDIDDINTCEDYRELFNQVDKEILEMNSGVSQNALNNSHGDWYEWIFAIRAWNYSIENQSCLLVPLPNKTSLKLPDLYKDEVREIITDLENKVNEQSDVHFITSNPDFVLINRETIDLGNYFNSPIEHVDSDVLANINSVYNSFLRRCSFEDIIGYLSIKTSFRPDRRIQIAHEGNLMKAIYTHLQTRMWIIDPPGIKYYAAAMKLSSKDIEGMKTVATHSITTVHSTPKAAVDEVFKVNSSQELENALSEITAESTGVLGPIQ